MAAWTKQREDWGKSATTVHPKKVETWKIFEELTGNADPLVIARFWLKHRSNRGGVMTISKAAIAWLKMRETLSITEDTKTHAALHLRRFVGFTGTKTLADANPALVRDFLASLEGMEPYTLRHHLRSLRAFFGYCIREKWTDDNPAEAIETPKIAAADITVISLADAQKLFSVNREALCIGRLALEAFGGLRYSSAARLKKEEIKFDALGLEFPASKHKTLKRHYVDGLPDNLWAWLRAAREGCWKMTPREYLDAKAKCFADAGVSNPGNVLRHSFCSYHVALHKDAARTAVLLTHRSPSMLYQHYRGMASESDAKAYFEIIP
jgi:integrase